MAPTNPLIYTRAKDGFIPSDCAKNWVFPPPEIANECRKAVPSEYGEFHSLLYAADLALPVVDLRMTSDWSPRVVHTDGSPNAYGRVMRWFEWLLIALGWMLSLLFVSAIGGIVRGK